MTMVVMLVMVPVMIVAGSGASRAWWQTKRRGAEQQKASEQKRKQFIHTRPFLLRNSNDTRFRNVHANPDRDQITRRESN